MAFYPLTVGELQTNAYIVACDETREAILVDPGAEAERILQELGRRELHLVSIALTHFHFDHVQAVAKVQAATQAQIAIHELDAPYLREPPRYLAAFSPRDLQADVLLHDDDVLTFGETEARVLHTPGHSPGSVSFWFAASQTVISGDALFREGIGRTDLPGGDHDELMRSIREVLYILPDQATVYPGHGPSTTIGYEKTHNPWVRATR